MTQQDSKPVTGDKTAGRVLQRVFVIDDDPINNLICESLIKKASYALEVRSFLGAAEALAQLAAAPPDAWPELILLDINMPGIDGWEFLARFGAVPGADQVPVYMLSSSVSKADLERALASPLVKGYLNKPLRREDLPALAA